jgi:ABC-type molybdate transport system permease subunit
MDWQALTLSLKLAAITLLVLLPIGLWLGRWLAYQQFKGKALVEALVVLPLADGAGLLPVGFTGWGITLRALDFRRLGRAADI